MDQISQIKINYPDLKGLIILKGGTGMLYWSSEYSGHSSSPEQGVAHLKTGQLGLRLAVKGAN